MNLLKDTYLLTNTVYMRETCFMKETIGKTVENWPQVAKEM